MKQEKFNYEELLIITDALYCLRVETAQSLKKGSKNQAITRQKFEEIIELSKKVHKMQEVENNNQLVAQFQSWNRKYEIDEMLDLRNGSHREFDIFDVTDGKPGKNVAHLALSTNCDITEKSTRQWLIKEAKAEIASLNIE